MPLQKQPYALQFQGGLDSKTDSKQVGYTKLLDLQNAVFVKQTTLVKRNGHRALGRSVDASIAPYEQAVGLAARFDELLVFADAHALSYRPSSDTWSDTGAVSSVVVESQPIARTGTDQTVPDAATNHDITALAWEDSRGGVWCSVVEASSSRILLAATRLDASGSSPRCLAVGEVVHILWMNGSNIWCAIVNPALPSGVPAAAALVIDLDTSAPHYDAVATLDSYDTTNKPGFITWTTPGGYRVGYIHPSGVIGSPVTGLPTAGTFLVGALTKVACAFWLGNPSAASPLAVALYGDVSSTSFRFVDGTSLSSTAKPTGTLLAVGNIRLACEFAASDVWWAAEQAGDTADVNVVRSGALTQLGAVTASATVRGHCLASRAFNDNGEIYVALTHPVLYFPYVAICQVSASMRAQARLLPGESSGQLESPAGLTRYVLPSVMTSDRQHSLALGYRIQLSGTSGTQFGEQGIQLFTLDFDHPSAYQSAQLGRGLYLAGGQHYDGDRWAEADFHCAPDTETGTVATTPASGGSLTSSGDYVYRICYEEIDGQGELHPGAVSVGILVTMGASDTQVTLSIPMYRLTSKKRVRIGVFRSLFNTDGAWFRVSSVDPNAAGANGYILNDPTVDAIDFIDKLADATVETLEPLYTNGGILGNDPSPIAGGVLAGGKGRLFWTDPTDPHLVYFSQQLRDDTAVEASAALSMRTDPYGGSVVGIAVMDDGVFAFKDTAIYVADGPGPDADGGRTSNNAFTPWALVTSDVGCKSPGSICQTPMGIAFQSQKGIKLLGRDRQVQDIGADVYGFNGQTIMRATLLPDRHQVVFLTDDGTTLLWDYLRGQWSRFTNHEGLDAVVVGGSYYYLRNDGRVFVETPGLYADDNLHIPMVIETAWVKMAGYLQGWQKVLHAAIIGAYKSSHQLLIRYRIDYQEAYTTLDPIDVDSSYAPQLYGAGLYGTGDYGGTPGPTTVYQEQVHLNQRCQSISFQISDIETTTSFGAAFELSELLLTGGAVGVKFPMGATRSQ